MGLPGVDLGSNCGYVTWDKTFHFAEVISVSGKGVGGDDDDDDEKEEEEEEEEDDNNGDSLTQVHFMFF